MVTTMHLEPSDWPLFTAVLEWRFRVNASFLAHHSSDASAAVASHTGSAGRNAACL
jgi:hypothetical protein